MLKDDNRNECQRREATVSKFTKHKSERDPENVIMKVSGVDFAPLTKGKAQLGKVSNAETEFLMEELHLRGIDVGSKE